MLVPKRVKHRREFRGKMRGEAKGGKEVAFGEYGLQATTSPVSYTHLDVYKRQLHTKKWLDWFCQHFWMILQKKN